MLAEDRRLQFLLAGVGHRPLGLLRHLVGLPEPDAPVQKQAQTHLHGMDASLGHDKAALGHGLQLVGHHEGPLDHLQGLAFLFSPAEGAAHHGTAPQGLGQLHCRLAGRGKSAEDVHLAVVDDDLGTFLTVVLLQLAGDALHDRHQHQAAGAGGGEHQFQRLDRRAGAQLVGKKDHPVFQPSAVLVRHGEDLPVQVLENEADHEILGLVLLREYDEDGGLLIAEGLRVDSGVKAQDLLHLTVQEGVQPGQHRGDHRQHGLLRGIQRGAGEPLGLVVGRELRQQELELVLALHAAGCQELLH